MRTSAVQLFDLSVREFGKGNHMADVIPHFKFHYLDISGRRTLCIETGGRIIHEISNLHEFYDVFGYPGKSGQADQLPDEFIWSEYVNNPQADFSDCIQVHIVEYLKKHSEIFNTEFGERCENWLADHVKTRSANGTACIACRLNPARKI